MLIRWDGTGIPVQIIAVRVGLYHSERERCTLHCQQYFPSFRSTFDEVFLPAALSRCAAAEEKHALLCCTYTRFRVYSIRKVQSIRRKFPIQALLSINRERCKTALGRDLKE